MAAGARLWSSRLLRPLFEAAAGEQPVALLAERLGLDATVLLAADGRLSLQNESAFWDELKRMSPDPNLGLHAAELMEVANLGLIGCLLEHSASLGDAARRAARFLRLLGDRAQIELEQGHDTARIRIVTEAAIPPRHAAEFTVAGTIVLARQLVGADFRPTRVLFRHASPVEVSEHVRIFGCPVQFDAPATAFDFSARWLEEPLRRADPAVCEFLDEYAELLVRGLPQIGPFDARVRAAYTECLLAGRSDVDAIAAQLGLTRRTLQRRLADRGSSHAVLLDRTRHHLALAMLADTNTPVKDIAFRLGFSDPSAFSRAFRRWTGVAPASYRQQQR